MSTRIVTIALGIVLLMGSSVRAQDTDAPLRTISVSGEGTVRAAPDQATVRFGVVTRAEDPEAARRQNAEAASQAMNAVRALGIPEENIRMETLRLQRHRAYNPQTQNVEEKGFEAIRQVVVDVDSLDLIPTLVARVVQRGANQLDGIQYGLKSRTAARNEALREAATDAREKAQLLAEALDAALGPVRQVSEQDFSFPRPQFDVARTAMMAKSEAAPEPDAYAPGEIEVTATVQVTFDLRPRADQQE